VLADALGWKDAKEAWIAVAWAKRSGLRLLERELRAFRKAKRRLRALVGLDQHGATIEGLELTLELFREARVYHDTARNPMRTFHPKLHVVEAKDRARAVIGSGNLTAGGFFSNYELSVALDLDLTADEDAEVLKRLREWFDTRWSHPNAARRLSKASIKQMPTPEQKESEVRSNEAEAFLVIRRDSTLVPHGDDLDDAYWKATLSCESPSRLPALL
jgi:HKD family nuclease